MRQPGVQRADRIAAALLLAAIASLGTVAADDVPKPPAPLAGMDAPGMDVPAAPGTPMAAPPVVAPGHCVVFVVDEPLMIDLGVRYPDWKGAARRVESYLSRDDRVALVVLTPAPKIRVPPALPVALRDVVVGDRTSRFPKKLSTLDLPAAFAFGSDLLRQQAMAGRHLVVIVRADQPVEGVTKTLLEEILATGASLTIFAVGATTTPAEWDRVMAQAHSPVTRAHGTRDLGGAVELEIRRLTGDGGRSVRPLRSVQRFAEPWGSFGPRITDAVRDGLEWLVAHQSPDGHWGAHGHPDVCHGKPHGSAREGGRGNASHDVGVTGLALLALLTSGVPRTGTPPFGQALERGARWLRERQDAEGCLTDRSDPRWIYDHIAGTHAMVEAYATTGSPEDRACARAAVKFLENARNPYFGWRYGVRPGDNDTSVIAWAMCALAAARDVDRADALTARPPTFGSDAEAADGASAWFQKMQDPDLGQVGYVSRGLGQGQKMGRDGGRYPPLAIDGCTLMGASTLFMAETTSDATGLPLTLKRIRGGIPRLTDGSTVDYNAWAFGTLAAWQGGGDLWSDWSPRMAEALLAAQLRDGDVCAAKGSFQVIDPWCGEGGRVYATAMGVLTALAPLRYVRAR